MKSLFPHALGTLALTSKGFLEEDFVKVAEYFDAIVKLPLKIKVDTKGIHPFHHLVIFWDFSVWLESKCVWQMGFYSFLFFMCIYLGHGIFYYFKNC